MTPSPVTVTLSQSPTQQGPAFGAQEHEEDRDPYVATPTCTVFSINISNCRLKHVDKVFRKRLMVPRKNEGNESRTEIKPSGTQPVPLIVAQHARHSGWGKDTCRQDASHHSIIPQSTRLCSCSH